MNDSEFIEIEGNHYRRSQIVAVVDRPGGEEIPMVVFAGPAIEGINPCPVHGKATDILERIQDGASHI